MQRDVRRSAFPDRFHATPGGGPPGSLGVGRAPEAAARRGKGRLAPAALLFLAWLLLPDPPREAAASAAPDFDLLECAWRASHVVLATEGRRIDGRLTVIESWVGALPPGAPLDLPRLAAFAPRAGRRAGDGIVVSGARVLLFLTTDAAAGTLGSSTDRGDLEQSLCWIEGGRAYALDGPRNRFGTSIRRLHLTEPALRARVAAVRADKDALVRLGQAPDVAWRLEGARRFLDSPNRFAAAEAMDLIKDSGRPAVRLLIALFEEHPDAWFAHAVCEALGAIGDPAAAPALVARLEAELGYWRKAADVLEPGWSWGAKWQTAHPQNDHADRVVYALAALRGIAAPAAEDVVRRTRALWSTAPALEWEHWMVPRRCDAVLDAIARARTPRDP